jgi:hypothetical protein
MGQMRRLLTAIGLGVGAMYFFDPQLGKQRREKFRDKFNSTLNQTRKDGEAKLRDLQNRAYGAYREISSSVLGTDERHSSQNPERSDEPVSKS